MEELRDIHSPPGVRHVTLKQLEKPVAGGSTGRGVCHSDTAFQQTPSSIGTLLQSRFRYTTIKWKRSPLANARIRSVETDRQNHGGKFCPRYNPVHLVEKPFPAGRCATLFRRDLGKGL